MTPQHGGRLLFLAWGRAVPRLAGAALGSALMNAEGGLLIAVGSAVFVGSVMTNWARWWHYVRAGTTPPVQPAAESRIPGRSPSRSGTGGHVPSQ